MQKQALKYVFQMLCASRRITLQQKPCREVEIAQRKYGLSVLAHFKSITKISYFSLSLYKDFQLPSKEGSKTLSTSFPALPRRSPLHAFFCPAGVTAKILNKRTRSRLDPVTTVNGPAPHHGFTQMPRFRVLLERFLNPDRLIWTSYQVISARVLIFRHLSVQYSS